MIDKVNNGLIHKIFSIHSENEFDALALEVFNHQLKENVVYRNYIQGLKVKPEMVTAITQIPFLPISFFKEFRVICGKDDKAGKVFTSSSTTSAIPSSHYVKDVNVYIESFRKGFSHFYGDVKEYCILALLPSYLEREGSSLVFMADDLIKNSNHPQSGFYMNNYEELVQVLKDVEQKGQKTLLLGVTYALLKLAEEHPMLLNNTIIMETGGMKGKREELPKSEVHNILKKAFGVNCIHSEYGMTELLSQGYSKGDGIFQTVPWMKVGIRDVNDPFDINFKQGRGAINIIDLANINSCSFIATDDMGVLHQNGSFEIAGRIDYSDIRGCNLMASEL